MKTSDGPYSKLDKGLALRLSFILSVIAFLRPVEVRADGGMVLLRQSQGPFTITVFTPAEILAGASSDVTVLVQDRETAGVILDAEVILRLAPCRNLIAEQKQEFCGVDSNRNLAGKSDVASGPLLIPAVHGPAAAKFLYAAPLAFPEAGVWNLEVRVREGGHTVDIPASLAVKAPLSRLTGLVPYLSLPPIVIALFLLNLWLRDYQLGRRRSGSLAILEAR
jgi:hypothetical protein